MGLQSIPILTRDQENEQQLYLAWEFFDWINENYPDAYDEYKKEVEKNEI